MARIGVLLCVEFCLKEGGILQYTKIILVGSARLEHATKGLRVLCSTN